MGLIAVSELSSMAQRYIKDGSRNIMAMAYFDSIITDRMTTTVNAISNFPINIIRDNTWRDLGDKVFI